MSKPKARKEHRCACCSATIRVGEQYVSLFTIFEGDAARERCCQACDAAIEEFAEAHEGTRSNPSYFQDMLRECMDEGDEESETRWKPMLAAIQARRP